MMLSECFHLQIRSGQLGAIFPRILIGNARLYYTHQMNPMNNFAQSYGQMKNHFDTEVNRSQYLTDWTSITFNTSRNKQPSENPMDTLQQMFDKLQRCQRALGPTYVGETNLRDTILRACRGVRELEYALQMPAPTCEGLFSQLRSSMQTSIDRTPIQPFLTEYLNDEEEDDDPDDEAFYFNRKYKYNSNRGSNRAFRGNRGRPNNSGRPRPSGSESRPWTRRCHVCNKVGCWSTKHSIEERRRSWGQYLSYSHAQNDEPTQEGYSTYLQSYEGNDNS
ncbi:hypothetical protein F4804DRAFT_302595 [Jackrogersella minutella]|nr:hypothetical protein F4804DRAFT_302595 [Jackrogersella minutella]